MGHGRQKYSYSTLIPHLALFCFYHFQYAYKICKQNFQLILNERQKTSHIKFELSTSANA